MYSGRFLAGLRAMMADSREEVATLVRALVATPPEQVTDNHFGAMRYQYAVFSELFVDGRFGEVVAEFARTGAELYRAAHGEPPATFHEQLDVIVELQLKSFIPLHEPVPEDVVVETRYDLFRWKDSNFARPLGEFAADRPMVFNLHINEYEHCVRLWEEARRGEDVRRIYLRSFASTNANRRRHLAYCDETAAVG